MDAVTEKQGGISFVHKKGDLVERTLGRYGALEGNILLWTPGSILGSIPPERVADLQERYKDVAWRGNVEVYLNHAPLFKQLKRLFESERRTNFFARSTVGLASVLLNWLPVKLARIDHYNPFTETAVVYNKNPAAAMHEIGHAEDFDQSEHPTLRAFSYALPFVRSKLEWNASRNAMKHMNPQEQEQARKVLEPALGTYIGVDIVQTAAMLFPPLSPITALGTLVGSLAAGHIHSRLPGSHNLFTEPFTSAKVEIHPSTSVQPALAPVTSP